MKEEEALARQQQELVRLTKDRQLHQRELKQRVRQIEATTAKVDQERMLSSGDASKQYEAYITRLKEMERRGKEACDQRREVAENMEKEWGRWLELLIACARSLQAKADSGVEAAALGDTETPAASVLDVVHRSEVRKARLKVLPAPSDSATSTSARLKAGVGWPEGPPPPPPPPLPAAAHSW